MKICILVVAYLIFRHTPIPPPSLVRVHSLEGLIKPSLPGYGYTPCILDWWIGSALPHRAGFRRTPSQSNKHSFATHVLPPLTAGIGYFSSEKFTHLAGMKPAIFSPWWRQLCHTWNHPGAAAYDKLAFDMHQLRLSTLHPRACYCWTKNDPTAPG